MIKGFLLDLDGVITDTTKDQFNAWKELANELHISIDLSFIEKLNSGNELELLDDVLRDENLENDFSEDEKLALISRKNQRYEKRISLLTKDDVYPGILTFLQGLRENHFLVGLASFNVKGAEILMRLEIDDYFDIIVNPTEISQGMPNPEIFIKGQELLALKPSEIIGVTSTAKGIEALKNAEIFAVGVGDKEILKDANLVFPDTTFLNLQEFMARDIL